MVPIKMWMLIEINDETHFSYVFGIFFSPNTKKFLIFKQYHLVCIMIYSTLLMISERGMFR